MAVPKGGRNLRLNLPTHTPGALGALTNPFHLARRGLWRAVASVAGKVTGTVLDVGCGLCAYRPLFAQASQYIGLEIPETDMMRASAATALYDGRHLPVGDCSVDFILCNQVIEHVAEPTALLSEIHRVLKPNGEMLLTVPFLWNEHELPHDYRRWTLGGVEQLLLNNGFEVIDARRLTPGGAALAQLVNSALHHLARSWPRLLRPIASPLLTAPITLLGTLMSMLSSKQSPFYLDNCVVARRRSIQLRKAVNE